MAHGSDLGFLVGEISWGKVMDGWDGALERACAYQRMDLVLYVDKAVRDFDMRCFTCDMTMERDLMILK